MLVLFAPVVITATLPLMPPTVTHFGRAGVEARASVRVIEGVTLHFEDLTVARRGPGNARDTLIHAAGFQQRAMLFEFE